MPQFTYSDLLGQRSTLNTAISEQNTAKGDLEEKIARLEKAISSMRKYITNVKDVESEYNKLTIDENRWKGTEKDRFDEQFQSLKENTKKYLTSAKDGKTTMEEEKERLEKELESVVATIERFEKSLSNVNSQINSKISG